MSKSNEAEGFPFKHEQADDSPGFLLWKITSLWQQKLTVLLDRLGLTQTQYAILASLLWLRRQEPATDPPRLVTQAQLAAHTRIDKMTLSKAVRKLEGKGLVSRKSTPIDLRMVGVSLTEQGHRVTQEAIVVIEAADAEFFGTLSPRQLEAYRQIAQTLVRASS